MGFIGSGYIDAYFQRENVDAIIQSFGNALNDNVWGEFDGIVCRGTSGLLVAPMLAHHFNKKLLVVRKPQEASHAGNTLLEGHDDIQKYVIVDDFVASGLTMEAIVDSFGQSFARGLSTNLYEPVHVGCYLWYGFMERSYCKENIAGSNSTRFNKVAKDKVYVSRNLMNSSGYFVETFNGYENK